MVKLLPLENFFLILTFFGAFDFNFFSGHAVTKLFSSLGIIKNYRFLYTNVTFFKKKN